MYVSAGAPGIQRHQILGSSARAVSLLTTVPSLHSPTPNYYVRKQHLFTIAELLIIRNLGTAAPWERSRRTGGASVSLANNSGLGVHRFR